MRIVIDTNLLVSAIISSGPPRRLLDAVRAGEHELCTTEILLAELLDVMRRSKFATRLAQAGLTPEAIVEDIRKLSTMVAPLSTPRVVPTDPDDDHVLAAAVYGAADLIISGDRRDLLPLGSHLGIAIVDAREALQRLMLQ